MFSPAKRLGAVCVGLMLAVLAAAPAHAALFDDDEARKAILELRKRPNKPAPSRTRPTPS